jgi:hypothetical protein
LSNLNRQFRVAGSISSAIAFQRAPKCKCNLQVECLELK